MLQDDLLSLKEAFAEAYEASRRTGCLGHIYRNHAGEIVACLFVPIGPQRREWLRVRPDGVIEEGNTRKELGTVKDLGL